jgi:thiol:disulfide interchange protein
VLLAAAGVLLVARIAACIYEDRNPPELANLVEWQAIAAAESLARTSGRPILYEFSAEWCVPCKTLEAEVFAESKSADILNRRFVPVRIVDRMQEDGRNSPEVQALEERFRVDSFPTLVVFAPETRRSEVIEGYPGRDNLMKQLVRAATRTTVTGSAPSDSAHAPGTPSTGSGS